MEKCKYCKKIPQIADVGGNVPYYEINCGCGKNAIVGSSDKQEAIDTWDAIQKG
jgi:hypothetical protein